MRDKLTALGFTAFRVPLSGAWEKMGGDVRGRKGGRSYIFEHKSTRGTEQVTLKRLDIEKVREIAKREGSIGVLTLSFKGKHNIYAILDLEDLGKIIGDNVATTR